MPYELQVRSDITSELRRIAAEQAQRALEQLQVGIDHPAGEVDLDAEDPWDEAVHDTRRRCKKIRAIVRLCRDELGDRYEAENAAFRDTARLLADARDAWTVIETLDDLADLDLDVLPAAQVAGLRGPLVARYLAVRDAAVQRDLLSEARTALTEAAAQIAGWPLPPDLQASDLRPSIARVHRRGARRWQQLRAGLGEDPSATTEVAHDMRKRVKYLRYQLEVLEQAWPDAMEAHSTALDDLGSLLGDDHDLAVLAQVVTDDQIADPALATKVIQAADLHRHHLRDQLTPLAEQLYVEPSEAFAERVTSYLDLRLT